MTDFMWCITFFHGKNLLVETIWFMIFLYYYLNLPTMADERSSSAPKQHCKRPIATEFFAKYMTRDRFTQFLQLIHFENNETHVENDRLWKIWRVFTDLCNKFSTFLYPFQKLVIEESLVLFKGRLGFKQYIPSKRYRFVIKLFVLCDCETGMILDIIVYTGTNVDIPQNDPLGISWAIAKKVNGKVCW